MNDSIRRQPLFYAALLLCLVIAVGSWIHFPQSLSANDVSHFVNQKEESVLGGVIVSEVEERESFYGSRLASFVLKAGRIWPDETGKESFTVSGKTKVFLKNPNEAIAYGDEIVMKGKFRFPKGVRNPGGFDTRAYYDRMGIRVLFYGGKRSEARILRRNGGNFLQGEALKLKRRLSDSLSREFDANDAAFLKALFLGERSDFDAGFRDLFIKTGTMHILAVSGFNIGFLVASLLFLMKPFPIPRDLKMGILFLFIWLYCLLVGWQAPVVRASFMASVFILGRILGRKTNVLNTLGFAALVILAVNPKQLFDLGFQLSFLAVFGLVTLSPVFIEKLALLPNEKFTPKEKIIFYFKELFWVSFISQIITMPVTVQNFYIVTPLSLLANLVVVPLSFLLFFAGIIFFSTFAWAPKFLSFVPWVMKLMMKIFTASLFAVENLPGAYFVTGKLNFFLWAVLVGGLVYFLLDKRIHVPLLRFCVLGLFCFNVFLIQDALRHFRNHKLQMTALDVGQGDAIYFEFPEGGNLLIDAGKGTAGGDKGRRVVAPFLKSKGVRNLDALVISHPQSDHIGGMPALLDEFKIRNVIDAGRPYDSHLFRWLQNKIEREKSARFKVHEGMRLEGFSGVDIRVLNPPRLTHLDKNINNDCVVLKISYRGTNFLLTGDIEERAMQNILEKAEDLSTLQCTVLKVPHHGASLKPIGEKFVQAVNPKFSVVSVGENNPYHHPSPETLRFLSAIPGNRVLRTDEDSAVRLVSNGSDVFLDSLS